MKVLALDLGTRTGFAVGIDGYNLSVGTWTLATQSALRAAKRERLDRRLDLRIAALWRKIDEVHRSYGIDFLIWEDVQFSTSTAQTQLWSSFRATCWIYAHQHTIKTECCPVATLKKFAAGSGSADKTQMARALCRGNERFVFKNGEVLDTVIGGALDDNAVDALHLLHWSRKTLVNLR